MASETEIECAILAADGTYNAMGLHAKELGRIIRELEAERDELRQTVDRLDDALRLASREKDEWEANYEALADTTPRIITAEELEVGQRVAVELNRGWFAGDVTGFNRVISNGCESTGPAKGLDGCTIILLADAPPQEPEQKRLTVEDLEAAEVGSVLEKDDTAWVPMIKREDGRWEARDGRKLVLDAHMIADIDERTLTPPEPARRGRVVKPRELRKGDVMDAWKDGILARKDAEVSGNIQWRDEEGWELRLISRKPPTVADSPITVHALHGEPVTTPNAAVVYKSGTQTEVSIAYQAWAVEDTIEGDDAVTDWTPLVPAGQEGLGMVRACRKRDFYSREEAEAWLEELKVVGRGKIPHRAYRCHRCPFWHTTSQRLKGAFKKGADEIEVAKRKGRQ